MPKFKIDLMEKYSKLIPNLKIFISSKPKLHPESEKIIEQDIADKKEIEVIIRGSLGIHYISTS